MWLTLFNKELALRYITDVDLYDAVKIGKWTVYMLTKYAVLATEELVADDRLRSISVLSPIPNMMKLKRDTTPGLCITLTL